METVLTKKPVGPLVFQSRQVLIFLVVFIASLTVRYNEYNNFRELTSDKSRQLHGAYELLQGNGVSYQSYNLTTFQSGIKPMVDWPPAYSYVIAGISLVTKLEVYQSSIVLDVLCLTGMWVILFWFTSLLNFSVLQRCLLFAFLAFAKTLFIKLYSSDLFVTTVFLLLSATTVNMVQNRKGKASPSFYLLAVSCIFLMIFLKYSILPAGFAIGLSLLSYSWFAQRKLSRPGIYLLIASAAFLATLILYNTSLIGHGNVLQDRHTNDGIFLHFKNLRIYDPFIVNAFFFLDVLYLRLGYYSIQYSAAILTMIILGWMTARIIKKIKKGEADFFSHLVLMVSISVAGFLTALSLRYPLDAHGSYEWTYVNEFRYFAPAVFLIILYLLKNSSFSPNANWSRKFISAFVYIGIVGTIVSGVYYFLTGNKAGSFNNLYGKVLRVADFMQKQKDENTYFISLTNHSPTDSEVTSLVATKGGKVIMSYYNYFPDTVYTGLFKKNQQLPPGKKLVVFIDHNEKLLDSLNPANRWTVEKNSLGEKFVVINNQ